MSGADAQRTLAAMTVNELLDMASFCAGAGLLFSAAVWLREAADRLEAEARLRPTLMVAAPAEPVT